MQASSYISALEEFFREEYIKEIERLAELFPEKRSLDVDFFRLDRHSPELGDELLERPDIIIKAAEEAIAGMNIVDSQGQTLLPNVRFFNLPEHRRLLIRNINSTHINKLVAIDGVITKITDVRPKIDIAVFECRKCGRQYKIPQKRSLFGRLEEPETCSCGRKDFGLVVDDAEFIDMQKMEVQEPLEALVRGEQAKNITVWLEDDLTNRLYAGDKIEVTGILRLIPPKNKGSVYSIYLQAVHVQQKETEFEEIEITEEEEKLILELAKNPDIYEKIVASIAPTIYGHKEIKEALALQLLGGTRGKRFPDKTTKIRPDIHILLIGDPGTAKSMLLDYIYRLAPKAVFVGGKSASSAGLTATAEKDEFGEGGWTLKAGALVLASGGQACIDEFDKMGDEDRSAMHEAMEQQRISIAKAGIVTTFKSETAILAAANPKFGRFDPYSLIAEQFDIPPTLLSRFDLIFPIRDVMDRERDTEMAEHILSAHQVAAVIGTKNMEVMSEEEFKKAEEKITPALDQVILRKYIAYARKHIFPILTKEAMEKLEEYYVELRRLGKEQGSVAATPRQLEALIRLSEASAKGRLSPKVEIEDAERAIRLHQFVMREIGIDRETGRFDIDIITTGQPKSRMDKARSVYNIIKYLCKEHDEVSKDMILNEVKSLGVEEGELNRILSMLKKSGDIYSPRYNFFKVVEEK